MTPSTALEALHLPPGPSMPVPLQTIAVLALRRRFFARMRERYGSTFTVHVPPFGLSVVISDPGLVRQLFTTSPAIAGNVRPNLGRVFGPGSIFSLDEEEHRARRKLLVPPLHGRRLKAYAALIEAETLQEAETWPQGREFETLTPFMRITLNVILRAVFGAEGAELDELREILPRAVEIGSRLAFVPIGKEGIGPWNPWKEFLALRRRYNEIIQALIDKALADPQLERRHDVLAMMLQSRYEDGEAMSRRDVADELATLLAAGHETTATTLAWAVERLRRHPAVLHRLVEEADADGSELLQATITEVQRTRPVITFVARRIKGPQLRLGEWVLPHGCTVLVGIELVQRDESVFPDARRFDPDRFVGVSPDSYAWLPFGGGTRRCVGAAFANLEMTVVLRTLLREYDLSTTDAPDEKWHSRGVAFAPARRGLVVVHRRSPRRRVTRGGDLGVPA